MESSLYFTEPFCWVILEAADSWISFVLKVCGHIMKRLSSWRWLFFCNDYNNMAVSFVSKLNFWRRKLYKIGLDSFLYLSWFTAMINTTVCLSRLFSTDLERHQYELDPVNAMFVNCLCLSISLENSRVYFPFLSTDCLQWSSIPMMLGSVFLDIAVIRHGRTIDREHGESQTRVKNDRILTVESNLHNVSAHALQLT